MGNNKHLSVTVDVRNLDCIKDTVKVINNEIVKNNGEFTNYDIELLNALLGDNWSEEYMIGKNILN